MLALALLSLVGASSPRLESEVAVAARPILPSEHRDNAERLASEAAFEEDKLGEDGHEEAPPSPDVLAPGLAAWKADVRADLLPELGRKVSTAPDDLRSAPDLAAREARGPPVG